MPSRTVDAGLLALALLLVACTRAPDATPATVADPASAAMPEAASADEPEEVVPPATAPPRTTEMGPAPAEGTIGFAGFGPAAFGADQEAVRMAWGKELVGTPAEPGGCYYLRPEVPAGGTPAIAFMLEQDRFVRIDVRDAAMAAPGGGGVGMDAAQIGALYGGRVQAMPHKYEQGAQYLRVAAPDGAASALLFETDAGGRVTGWRIGLPPQVDYVEGCG